MTQKEFDPKSAIYAPDEASTYAVQAIEIIRANKNRGASMPIDGISSYFAPLLPGQICAVIAQTSQYKSGFMRFWERELARQINTEKRTGYGIFHVSVEEGVEEQVFQELAHEMNQDAGSIARGEIQDWNLMLKKAVHIGQVPVYRIGDSIARAEDMPFLTMSNMIRSIQAITEGAAGGVKIKPAAIFFDYLQAFPFDNEIKKMGAADQQRRLQVREDVFRLRQAAAHFECPVVVAVQAKQELTSKNEIKMPGIYDGEESSSIAQRMDRIITLWMPARTKLKGDSFNMAGKQLKVEENMLFVQVAKQRGGLPAGRVFPCRVDFVRNIITHDPSMLGVIKNA
jgi:replicative DNA helicase